MIRKLAVQVGVSTLLLLIACNAYLAVNHLRKTQKMTALILESSAIQRDISGILLDLIDMETSQRGYLLTGDTTYLQPYTEAKGKIEADFVGLRVRLSKRMPHQQSLESQLESLAASKQSEMEHSINLRQHGYRYRSFKLVSTNEGKNYMDEIRRIVSSISSVESSNLAKFDREKNVALKRGVSVTVIASAGAFVLAACLFWLIRDHGRMLEKETSQSRRELVLREMQLEKLTSALSGQARFEIIAIKRTSRLLLENYGGFLPRQGHEYAEQMNEAAIQIERLRQDLVGSLSCEPDGQVA